VEIGETLQAAVAREVLEETGFEVEVGPVIEVFDRIMRDSTRRVQFHFVLVDYVCKVKGGRIGPSSDVDAVALADPQDLGDYKLTEKSKAVITKALELIQTANW
jgi:ADP-ribose pyrophosphatase YjhB (NUDIX family)